MTSWDIQKIIENIVKLQIDISGLKTELSKLMIDTWTRLEKMEYYMGKYVMPSVSHPSDREYERIHGLPSKHEDLKKNARMAEKVEGARLRTNEERRSKGDTKDDTQDLLEA